jgi:glycosyltransferase involved in cell wall biosynthesis
MRITIICGFFLPMPPTQGGSTEKSWHRLAREFADRGHTVTIVSRRWPERPNDETRDGIRYLRLPGWDHQRSLVRNLLYDFWWSWRVFFALPDADIVVVNAVALPVWLGRLKPRAGRVVIMTGRMPKGQYRRYRAVQRVLAASSYVQARVLAENPALAPVASVYGYPIDWQRLSAPATPSHPSPDECVIGYIGRLHEEKGLALFADAIQRLAARSVRPPWRILVCGPADVARGGSGVEFRDQWVARLRAAAGADRVDVLEPQFDDAALARVYQRIGIFCYPSLAEQGETFGVAVAEAMAAGAVTVVSKLACFTDFVRDGQNGVVFNHAAPDAAEQLAAALAGLLEQPDRRRQLADAGRNDVARYDYVAYAERLLADFTLLTAPQDPASSAQ